MKMTQRMLHKDVSNRPPQDGRGVAEIELAGPLK